MISGYNNFIVTFNTTALHNLFSKVGFSWEKDLKKIIVFIASNENVENESPVVPINLSNIEKYCNVAYHFSK